MFSFHPITTLNFLLFFSPRSLKKVFVSADFVPTPQSIFGDRISQFLSPRDICRGKCFRVRKTKSKRGGFDMEVIYLFISVSTCHFDLTFFLVISKLLCEIGNKGRRYFGLGIERINAGPSVGLPSTYSSIAST